MAHYLITVTLETAQDSDYGQLACAMEQLGFNTRMPTQEQSVVRLPRGHFWVLSNEGLGLVRSFAESAVISTGKKGQVLAVRADGVSTSGLQLVEGARVSDEEMTEIRAAMNAPVEPLVP